MGLSESIATAEQLAPERLAELTSKFVAVPSVNGEHPERDLALVIAEEMDGYETELVGSQSRPSLGVRGKGEPKILLNGHTDTVPVDDAVEWRYDPFAGVIADGSVHGRGACDMKGGLAVQVAVAQWLASESSGEGLVLHFAMGEERGEPGTEDLINSGFLAPGGLVLEPTDLRLGIAQRGLITLQIAIEGRAGHASRPDLTSNPIDRIPAILRAIESLEANPSERHDLLGTPTWTTTVIRSGVIPSMVPGRADVYVDRRMVPGESVESVVSTLQSALAAALPGERISVSVADEEGIYQPAEVSMGSPTVGAMRGAMEMFDENLDVFGTPYSSDVRHLVNKAGVEAVTYGPGRFSEMHARDEYIEVDALTRAARVVAACAALMLGR